MKKPFYAVAVLVCSVLLLPSCSRTPVQAREAHSDAIRVLSPQVADPDLAKLVAGNNDFAFSLYRQFASDEGNVFYSPYSVSLALAMTYAGARNRTADQMAQALHFTLPQDRLHPAFNKMALELESRSKSVDIPPDQAFQLSVANSLWGQSGAHFEQEFLDLLARNYAAGMRLADFAKDAEAARQEINDWVSQSTNQKIKDIVPPGAVDALTRLVLANAVYFKAAWSHPFNPKATRPGPFHLLDGKSVDAPMMREQTGLSFTEGEDYRAVELPYAGWQFSMLILLPDEGKFGGLEARLDSGLINEIMAARQYAEVILTLPKFKFEWSRGLAAGLAALGMPDAFDPSSADFSGIDGARDLFISDVLHKAFIAVDEKGTEAAAATVVIMPAAAPPATPTEITVDRPFFFIIRDNPTGAILFLGRVMNPAA